MKKLFTAILLISFSHCFGQTTTKSPTPCSSGIHANELLFDENSAKIKTNLQQTLATLAAEMKYYPTCTVVVSGCGDRSKRDQQRSWDRVNAVIEYLSEKHNIDRGRFIFQYGQPGTANLVILKTANPEDEHISVVPPPFPNLHQRK